jgi:hypothetical protein
LPNALLILGNLLNKMLKLAIKIITFLQQKICKLLQKHFIKTSDVYKIGLAIKIINSLQKKRNREIISYYNNINYNNANQFWTKLNMITLGHRESDNVNRKIIRRVAVV